MNQNKNARAMMGFVGWGPVGGVVLASKTSGTNQRIQYATQFGPTLPASLTFTSSNTNLSVLIYGMDHAPVLGVTTYANYNAGTNSIIQYCSNPNSVTPTWATGSISLPASTTPLIQGVNWIPQLNKFFISGGTASQAYIGTSTDGKNFITSTYSTSASLSSGGGVAYGNGTLVCQLQPSSMSLQSNAFLYSTNNGSTWATASTPTNGWNAGNGPYGIFYIPSSGMFITVGSTTTTAYAATSSNGINWTVGTPTGMAPSASGAINLYKGIAWAPNLGTQGKGRAVIAWYSGNATTHPSQYSDDGGYTWITGSAVTSAVHEWYSIIWEPYSEIFWVVDSNSAKVWGSKDGINWTSYTSAAAGASIVFAPQYIPPIR
jgi:hypothetical protein